jgi:REP element-mobilizing transposase RayT
MGTLMAEIYHINFHTQGNRPVFLDDAYARAIDEMVDQVIRHHGIASLARAVMPTHLHFVVVAFPDQPRERIVQLLKGAPSRVFFQQHPDLGAELGGHLWQKDYQWILITSHDQLVTAIRYVRANRLKIGLGPIAAESVTLGRSGRADS